jgi:hypothetical protein
MCVPRMLSIEEWEKVAAASQAALIEQARDEQHGVGDGVIGSHTVKA